MRVLALCFGTLGHWRRCRSVRCCRALHRRVIMGTGLLDASRDFCEVLCPSILTQVKLCQWGRLWRGLVRRIDLVS